VDHCRKSGPREVVHSASVLPSEMGGMDFDGVAGGRKEVSSRGHVTVFLVMGFHVMLHLLIIISFIMKRLGVENGVSTLTSNTVIGTNSTATKNTRQYNCNF
jgi:hypothetical protein